MTDDERFDPADELRRDIESAIEGQGKGREPAPERSPDAPAGETTAQSVDQEPAAEDISGRQRDDKGRFVAKIEPGEPEAAAEPAEKPQDAKAESAALDAPKTDVRPPSGFSVATKAIWDTLPQSVRDDIAKREQEVDAGFKRYAGLGKHAEEAERNGTTLQNAVNDYVAVETALRQNFVGGIEFICQRMGVDPRQVVQAMVIKYAPALAASGEARGAAAPADDRQQMIQEANQRAQAELARINPDVMAQQVARQVADVLRNETQQRELNSQIAAFGADPNNKFFANLRQDMSKIVQAGKAETLQEAYDAACWLNPQIRAILINEANGGRNKEAAAAASKSRAAAKAVGGAPTPGVNPDTSGKRRNLSLDEEIRAAIDAQSGAA
jgi:hypothetical protein